VNRAEELRRAVTVAGLSSAAVRVYDALLSRADWATGSLPAGRQPRSLAQVAAWAGLSRSYVAEALNVLERFGWLARDRPAEFRHGRATTYRLAMGRARPAEATGEPMTGAERTRRWRERQRSGPSVTVPRDEPAGPIDRDVTTGPIARDVTDRSSVRHRHTNGQVNSGFVPVGNSGGTSGETKLQDQQQRNNGRPPCIGGCGQVARRACKTCWEHACLEIGLPPYCDRCLTEFAPALAQETRGLCRACEHAR
jgi:hypothetical protein